MTSSMILAFVSSVVAFVASRWGKRSNANPKGNTGNVIVDFFYGREYNPVIFRLDQKLQAFRFSMMLMAMINVAMVLNHINSKAGAANPAVVMAGAFQVKANLTYKSKT